MDLGGLGGERGLVFFLCGMEERGMGRSTSVGSASPWMMLRMEI